MMVHEVLGSDKFIQTMFMAKRRKKNNPKKSKTTKMNSFIDTFGGLAGYSTPDTTGSGGMTHNA